VNGFCFNKKYNTFASYGGDGTYCTWNKDTKSKYRSSEVFPEPIVAADQTEDGLMMAYAIGYDWQRGAEG
jgi:mRNA export factor